MSFRFVIASTLLDNDMIIFPTYTSYAQCMIIFPAYTCIGTIFILSTCHYSRLVSNDMIIQLYSLLVIASRLLGNGLIILSNFHQLWLVNDIVYYVAGKQMLNIHVSISSQCIQIYIYIYQYQFLVFMTCLCFSKIICREYMYFQQRVSCSEKKKFVSKNFIFRPLTFLCFVSPHELEAFYVSIYDVEASFQALTYPYRVGYLFCFICKTSIGQLCYEPVVMHVKEGRRHIKGGPSGMC